MATDSSTVNVLQNGQTSQASQSGQTTQPAYASLVSTAVAAASVGVASQLQAAANKRNTPASGTLT